MSCTDVTFALGPVSGQKGKLFSYITILTSVFARLNVHVVMTGFIWPQRERNTKV